MLCLIIHKFAIFFQGENDIEQLCCVLKALGTPNEEIWPVSVFVSFWGIKFHVMSYMNSPARTICADTVELLYEYGTVMSVIWIFMVFWKIILHYV